MRCFLIILGLSILTFTGCESDPRTQVTGSVSFDGSPVPDGDIFFIDQDNVGQRSVGKIKEGKYSLPVMPGKKRVEIRASRIQAGGPKGAMGEPVAEDYIPERYNVLSTLSADVAPSGPNTFDFPLTSQ